MSKKFTAFITASLAVVGMLVAVPATGSESVGGRPVLLLVYLAEDEESAALERKLRGELDLALDRFLVNICEMAEDFASFTLPSKLERIRPVAAEQGAEIASWIEVSGQRKVTLHLATLGEIRASVRTLEVELGPEAGAELALAVRELVEEVFPAQEQPQEKTAVAKQKPYEWAMVSSFQLGGGVLGQVGPSLRFGGRLAADWWYLKKFHLRLSLALLAGPRRYESSSNISGWGLEPGLGAGPSWHLGPILFSPYVIVVVPWSTIDLSLGPGVPASHSWWSFGGGLGLDLRFFVTRNLAVVLDGSARALAHRVVFERLTDRGQVFATPWLDWQVAVGLAFSVD